MPLMPVKLGCDSRFQRANENENACSKRTLKTTVATQLYTM